MDMVSYQRDSERIQNTIQSFSRAQEGNKGDRWLNGQVTIRSSSYFRLSIEGVIGKDSSEMNLYDSKSSLILSR